MLLAVLVVPMFDEKLVLEPSMIPIDIVDVGPVAAPHQGEARPEPPPAAAKPTVTPPAPPPPPKPEPQPPAPPQPPPEPKAEVPDVPKPHEKPVPPKPEPPKVEPPKPEPPPPAKPPEKKPPEKKVEKPPEKPPEKKPPDKPAAVTDPLASVLNNIDKLKKDLAAKQPPAKPTPAALPGTAKPSAATGTAPMVSDRLTGPQEDALRSQIGHCWNVDPGARNARDMIIDVVIEVNPDRTVAKAEIAEKSRARMYTDPAYRAAAESALRAVKNPRCQPLALPPEKYDMWRRITFTFNPKDML